MPANPPALRRILFAGWLAAASLAPAPRPTWAQEAAPAVDASQARIDEALDDLVSAAKRLGGVVGVAVVDLRTGKTVAEHRGATPHNPASNMKVFTAWAALKELGPDHRYLTALRGRLRGDRVDTLVLRGDGDPSLEIRHLQEMVARLHRAGVRKVGDIVVDQGHFDGIYVPPAFNAQPHEWAAFRAPVAAVSLAGNTVMLEVRAGAAEEKARVSFVPKSFVDVSGSIATSAKDRPEAVQLSLAASGSHLKATVGGSLPAGSPTLRLYKRVEDPTLLAGYALADVCRQQGIAVSGEIEAGKGPKGELLSAHRSVPLARLLYALGKFSNNFYAEMVFKSLSVGKGQPPASFAASARRLEALLDEAKIERRGAVFHNGSGLFEGARVSPLTTAELLRAAFRDPALRPEMLAQLSVGGADGTLRRRFRDQSKRRLVRGKTGTLAAVSALSGYVLSPDAQGGLAFSLMANEVRGKAVTMRKHLDRFVKALAAETSR